MQTAGQYTQDTPFNDAQVFMACTDFVGVGGTPLFSFATVSGISMPVLGATTAAAFTAIAQISGQTLRTGNFPPSTIQTMSGQAFGTAAALPGPQAAVPGTSSPSGFGINQVVPPVLKANLPTIVGSVPGAKPKGIQINWIDWLYQVTGTASAGISVQANLTVCPIGLGATPVITNLLGATAISAVSQAAGKLNRVRTTPTVIQMFNADGSVITINFGYTWAAGVSTLLVGAILGCSYNYN